MIQISGNASSHASARMANNGSGMIGSVVLDHTEDTTDGYSFYAFTRIVNLTASDVLQVEVRNGDTSNSHRVLQNSFVFSVERLS